MYGKATFLVLFIIAFVLFPARPGYASIASFFFKSAGADEIDHVPSNENLQNIDVLDANLPPKPGDMPKETVLVSIEGDALVPEVGPMGTIADIKEFDNAPGPDQISLYTVRSGDSLTSIAKMYGVSEGTIRAANDIKKGQSIPVGDKLLILPITGVEHTVKKGDTIASVAKKYGADADEIALYNDLVDGKLVVGDEIIIPDGEMPESSSSSSSSSSSVKPTSGKGTGSASTNGFIRPVKGIVTQGPHHTYKAIDFGAPTGTPVRATAAGKVIAAKTGNNGGYGNMVIISHSDGTQSLYAHLSSISVSTGQSVEQGQNIGKVGSTGRSTGSHLHFEIRGATARAQAISKLKY